MHILKYYRTMADTMHYKTETTKKTISHIYAVYMGIERSRDEKNVEIFFFESIGIDGFRTHYFGVELGVKVVKED
jgi:hypothetical protein